jgi:hypothetical protein
VITIISPSLACKGVLAFRADECASASIPNIFANITNLSNLDFFAPKGSERNIWTVSTLANIGKLHPIAITSNFEDHVRYCEGEIKIEIKWPTCPQRLVFFSAISVVAWDIGQNLAEPGPPKTLQ